MNVQGFFLLVCFNLRFVSNLKHLKMFSTFVFCIPEKLSMMGLKEGDIEKLANNAMKDICMLTNPRQGSVEDIIDIYQAAL
ncbi:hypothetical protein [Dehalobacter sp. 4CP]|uniref:hypothetical protein n=1 Tax=Dehalobacter sp. CP TaxID=2594474 RepID=UPI0039E72E73